MAAAPWNPGKPTLARQIDANTYAMDSFREGVAQSYTVTLCEHPACSCKAFAYGKGKACKHIVAARQQASWLALVEKARTLSDHDLTQCLKKYTLLGRADVTGALRVERARRRAAAAREQVGHSVKLWGPTTEAEAAALLRAA